MGMTIDEIIKYLPSPICGSTVIASEKQKEYEAHDTAVIIMHKYQKIEQIIDDWNNGKFSDAVGCLRVKAVVEDGKA